MDQFGRFPPADWRADLQPARLQISEYLGQFFFNRSLCNNGRWVVLLAGTLFCAMRLPNHGNYYFSIMISILVASFVSGIAGFAFSAVCGALLFHLSDNPVQVVQVMITCSIANQAAMTCAARREIVWRHLSVYLAGGALGLTLGVWILLHADHTHYTRALGIFLLAYGFYMFMRRPVVFRRQPAAMDFATGFLGGVTGGAAAFPGAFVTIWCGMKGWDKTRQRAVFQPFILIMQIAALLAIGFCPKPGATGIDFNTNALLFIPASLLGTALGLAVYRRLSDIQFAQAVNVLLIVSGLSYVV